MCLTLRTDSLAPYNDSNIRYKMMRKTCLFEFLGIPIGTTYEPLYYPEYGNYKRRGWMKAKLFRYFGGGDDDRFGFHVFVNLDDTRLYNHSEMVVAWVEVKNFLRSGTWEGKQCETWEHMRILGILK